MRFGLILFVCAVASAWGQNNSVRYVALGDSYTIGTGAKEKEAWPSLLAKHLNEKEIGTELVANPARNGFTSQKLIDTELPVFDQSKTNFVTLQIGVNDWVRGVAAATFQKNLTYILDYLQSTLPDKKRILLVTIPDFGVTPKGDYYGEGRDVAKGISEFNAIIKGEAKKRSLTLVDVFEISKKMKDDPGLIAADGLHPSAKEYALWESLIFPAALKMLKK